MTQRGRLLKSALNRSPGARAHQDLPPPAACRRCRVRRRRRARRTQPLHPRGRRFGRRRRRCAAAAAAARAAPTIDRDDGPCPQDRDRGRCGTRGVCGSGSSARGQPALGRQSPCRSSGACLGGAMHGAAEAAGHAVSRRGAGVDECLEVAAPEGPVELPAERWRGRGRRRRRRRSRRRMAQFVYIKL